MLSYLKPPGVYGHELGVGNLGSARANKLSKLFFEANLQESASHHAGLSRAAWLGPPCPFYSPGCFRSRRWWFYFIQQGAAIDAGVCAATWSTAAVHTDALIWCDCSLWIAGLAQNSAPAGMLLGMPESTGLVLHEEPPGIVA